MPPLTNLDLPTYVYMYRRPLLTSLAATYRVVWSSCFSLKVFCDNKTHERYPPHSSRRWTVTVTEQTMAGRYFSHLLLVNVPVTISLKQDRYRFQETVKTSPFT